MPLICQIPSDETYDLPEGRYRARLVKVRPHTKQSSRGSTSIVRLLFEVDVPSLQNKTAMAGRNFIIDLRRQSDLRGFLEAWRGAELFANPSQPLDLELLVDAPAEVVLRHIKNPSHPRPYVLIESIHPPGALWLTSAEPVELEQAA